MDNSNTKQKLIIQVVCLLLSIGLWFYVNNTENPLMLSDLNKVPVKLINVDVLKDSKFALVPNQEFYVNLKIEGLSQDLRKVNKDDFEIIVDLSEYTFKKGETKIPVSIVDFPTKINIKNNNNLTVKINIEEYVEKEFPVDSNIEIIGKPTYYVAPPVFNPNTVKISGPNSVVSRVSKVVAIGRKANISETIVDIYNIEPRDGNGNIVTGVELSATSVEGTIKVNAGKTVPIKLQTIGNINAGLKINNIELSRKEVQIIGPEENISNIGQILTEPIDLSTIKENSNIEVNLKIPEGAQVNLGEEKVAINIIIEKIISKEFTVAFTIVGLNEGLKVVPKTETIKIKISDYEDVISKIKPENIKAELNVSEHKEPGTFSGIPSVKVEGLDLSSRVEVLDKVEYELTLQNNNPQNE